MNRGKRWERQRQEPCSLGTGGALRSVRPWILPAQSKISIGMACAPSVIRRADGFVHAKPHREDVGLEAERAGVPGGHQQTLMVIHLSEVPWAQAVG